MSEENKGQTGVASLRLNNQKLSELPMGLREQAYEQMPAFIEEQRRLKVDRITGQFPRGTEEQYNANIRVCEANIKTFAAAKQAAMANIGKYSDLLKNPQGDLTQEEVDAMAAEHVAKWVEEHSDNEEWVRDGRPIPGTLGFHQLMAELKPINARLRMYVDEELWKQIGMFQEERDRYDDAVKQETESIFAMRDAINLVRERDRQIKRAMTEPLSVD